MRTGIFATHGMGSVRRVPSVLSILSHVGRQCHRGRFPCSPFCAFCIRTNEQFLLQDGIGLCVIVSTEAVSSHIASNYMALRCMMSTLTLFCHVDFTFVVPLRHLSMGVSIVVPTFHSYRGSFSFAG